MNSFLINNQYRGRADTELGRLLPMLDEHFTVSSALSVPVDDMRVDLAKDIRSNLSVEWLWQQLKPLNLEENNCEEIIVVTSASFNCNLDAECTWKTH